MLRLLAGLKLTLTDIAIESQLNNVRIYITAVSLPNEPRHNGESFTAKGNDNSYLSVAQPLIGKRFLNISDTDDDIVPYVGAPSRISDNNGSLVFLLAEEQRRIAEEGEYKEIFIRPDHGHQILEDVDKDRNPDYSCIFELKRAGKRCLPALRWDGNTVTGCSGTPYR